MIFFRYATSTLPINYSGAAGHYGRGANGGIHRIFSGLGIRSLILIVLSSLCLVFASIFVCVCLRKSKLISKLNSTRNGSPYFMYSTVLQDGSIFALFYSEHPPHTNGIGYGEIPKSCTMENGGNRTSTGSSSNGGGSNASNVPLHPTEHQIYATIQRKQPPFPPFGGGGGGGVGNGCNLVDDHMKMLDGRCDSGGSQHHSHNLICPKM